MIRHPKTSEAQREYMKEYYQRNKASMKARHQAYYKAHKEEILRKEKAARDPEERWAYQLKRKFGITVERYNQLLAEQGGVCAICKKLPSGRFKRLAVDHCHKTGKIRGLLHSSCNRAIGFLFDDPNIVDAAAAYLRGVR